MIKNHVNLTTEDLRNEVWGTPCGSVGPNKFSLSHPLVIDFIDTFFGGVLDDVEIDTVEHELFGGGPTLKKPTITQEEFEKFISFDNRQDVIENIADLLEEDEKCLKNVEKLNQDQKYDLMCFIFSIMVGYYGGSLRCDYMYDGIGGVDLESE